MSTVEKVARIIAEYPERVVVGRRQRIPAVPAEMPHIGVEFIIAGLRAAGYNPGTTLHRSKYRISGVREQDAKKRRIP